MSPKTRELSLQENLSFSNSLYSQVLHLYPGPNMFQSIYALPRVVIGLDHPVSIWQHVCMQFRVLGCFQFHHDKKCPGTPDTQILQIYFLFCIF